MFSSVALSTTTHSSSCPGTTSIVDAARHHHAIHNVTSSPDLPLIGSVPFQHAYQHHHYTTTPSPPVPHPPHCRATHGADTSTIATVLPSISPSSATTLSDYYYHHPHDCMVAPSLFMYGHAPNHGTVIETDHHPSFIHAHYHHHHVQHGGDGTEHAVAVDSGSVDAVIPPNTVTNPCDRRMGTKLSIECNHVSSTTGCDDAHMDGITYSDDGINNGDCHHHRHHTSTNNNNITPHCPSPSSLYDGQHTHEDDMSMDELGQASKRHHPNNNNNNNVDISLNHSQPPPHHHSLSLRSIMAIDDNPSIAQRRRALGTVRDSWRNHSPEQPLYLYEPIIEASNGEMWNMAFFALHQVMKHHLNRHGKSATSSLSSSSDGDNNNASTTSSTLENNDHADPEHKVKQDDVVAVHKRRKKNTQ